MVDGIVVWYTEAQARLDRVCASAVTAEEVARAGRLRHPEDAAAFLASRALLRTALSAQTGIAPQALVLDRRCAQCGDPDHGRPVLRGAQGASLEFSLTRARAVAAVALCATAVGLDAEPDRPDLDGIAGSEVFSEEDRAWIDAGGGATRARRCLALWVRKEAVGKASGLGVIDAGAISARPQGDPAAWAAARDARGLTCHVAGIVIPGAAAAAVAAYRPSLPILVRDARALAPGAP